MLFAKRDVFCDESPRTALDGDAGLLGMLAFPTSSRE